MIHFVLVWKCEELRREKQKIVNFVSFTQRHTNDHSSVLCIFHGLIICITVVDGSLFWIICLTIDRCDLNNVLRRYHLIRNEWLCDYVVKMMQEKDLVKFIRRRNFSAWLQRDLWFYLVMEWKKHSHWSYHRSNRSALSTRPGMELDTLRVFH